MDFRSIYEIYDYIVPNDESRRNDKMWTWPVVANCHSYEEVKNLYEDIYRFYRSRIRFENKGPLTCVVILFMFALYTKLNTKVWGGLRDACMNVAGIDNDGWQTIVATAEQKLNRLTPKVVQRYVARVKIEAGIPLTAMNGFSHTHMNALLCIWNHLNSYYGVDWSIWARNNADRWPGRNEAGVCYADAGKDLLTELYYEGEDNYENFLRNKSFDRPRSFINAIQYGLQNGSFKCDYIPWLSIIRRARRILDIGRSEIYIHFEMTNRLPCGWENANGKTVKFLLSNSEGENLGNVVYRANGSLYNRSGFEEGQVSTGDFYRLLIDLWNPVQGLSLKCFCGDDSTENYQLFEGLVEDNIWFFKKESDGTGTWIPNRGQIRDNFFPLYIVVPKKDCSEYEDKLGVGTILVANEFYDERVVYICENRDKYISTGFSWCQLDENPVQQIMDVWSNGVKMPRVNLGVPSAAENIVYYEFNNSWENASNLKDDKFYALRFSLNGKDDFHRGHSFAILPSAFKYKMERANDAWKATFGENNISPMESWIEDSWGNRKNSISPNKFCVAHEDIACFKFASEIGTPVTIRIPSPEPGASWRWLDNGEKTDANSQKKNFADVQRIPDADINFVRLYYKSNLEVVGAIEILWTFELSVQSGNSKTTLAVSESSQNLICDNSNMLLLKIPVTSIKKLFAATNHPDAIVEIKVSVWKGNDYVCPNNVLTITRYDEATCADSHFYFGLLKGCISKELPNNNKDIWIKVPCFSNTLEWNGRHRLERVNDSIDEDSFNLLKSNQKVLMNGCNTGSYGQIAKQIRDYYENYFVGKNVLSLEDLQFLRSYVCKCAVNKIPLCNLWLLQEVLHDDRLVCKLPAATEINRVDKAVNEFLGLKENIQGVFAKNQGANRAFDWRLVRLLSVDKYAVINKDRLKEKIETAFDCADAECEQEKNQKQFEPEFYAVIDGKLAKRDFADFKYIYETYFENPWENVEIWKKAICFIVEKVILTEDDDEYRQYHGDALCYLRQLEIFDAHNSSIELKKIRDWRKRQLLEDRKVYYAECFKRGWDKGAAMSNNSAWKICDEEDVYYEENLLQRNVLSLDEIKKEADLYGLMLSLWRNEMLLLLSQADPSNLMVSDHKKWVVQCGFYNNLLKNLTNETMRQAKIKSISKQANDFFEEKFKGIKESYTINVIANFERKYNVRLSTEEKGIFEHQNVNEICKKQDRIQEMKALLNLPNTVWFFRCSGDDFCVLKDLLLKNANAIERGFWKIPDDRGWKNSLNEAFKQIAVENKDRSEFWCLARLRLGFEDAREEMKQIVEINLTTVASSRRYWNDFLEHAKGENGARLYSDKDIANLFSDVYAKQGDGEAAKKAFLREWRMGR